MVCRKSDKISWIIRFLFLDFTFTYGLKACRRELITNVSLPTELESEVLLPCSFESDLLNSGQKDETSVVWTHLTTETTYIMEIGLDGFTKSWDNRHGRIRTESKPLDFSIRIRKVQQSDLGVYHCELFREINCSLAYKRIELLTVDFQWPWMIIAGAAGGGAALIVLTVFAIQRFKRQAAGEVTYASIIYRSHNSHESNVRVQDNLINASTEDSAHASSDTVLYATIKRGHEKENTASEL